MRKIVFILMVVCTSTLFGQSPDVPKGQYQGASLYPNKVEPTQILYWAGAKQLAETWTSSSFKIEDGVYQTGPYGPEQELSSESPAVFLPAVSINKKLYLQLVEEFEVESYYDKISVELSTDSGKSYQEIYARTGISKGKITDYVELTRYAGQNVRFRLHLISDSTYGGSGWQLTTLSVVETGIETSTLRNQPVSVCSKLGEVNILGIEWEDNQNGIIAFTLADTTNKFMDQTDLESADFTVIVNQNVAGCLKLENDNQKQKVDVVFAIDNSGSMNTYQDKVFQTLRRLVDSIGNNFDASAALVRFGFSRNDCPVYWEKTRMGNSLLSIPSDPYNKFWGENKFDGSKEPYYAVLLDIAQKQLDYRPLSQKVIIMMGDETASQSPNNKDCMHDNVVRTQQEVVDTFSQLGFQVFMIGRKTYENDLKNIVETTGGSFHNITDTSYIPIMHEIAKKINQRYYLHFCMEEASRCGERLQVELNFCDSSDVTSSIIDYSGFIYRTDSTIRQDSSCVMPYQPVNISFRVDGRGCKTVDYATIGYGYFQNDSVWKDTIETVPDAVDDIYTVTIPANRVTHTLIAYNILVYFTDGSYVSASPIANNISGYTWTIPICEKRAPQIINVEWEYSNNCIEKEVSITIESDTTIVKTYLFYAELEEEKEIGNYKFREVEMTLDSTDNQYHALITAAIADSTSLIYYIYTEDADGLKGWYGNGNETVDTVNACRRNNLCASIFLETNPIRRDSDTLRIELSEQSDLHIYLMDSSGHKVSGIESTIKNMSAGHYNLSLSETLDLFNQELEPLTPYLLVIDSGKEIVIMYLYISRL